MRRFYFLSIILLSALLSLGIVGSLGTAQAAISGTGDINPSLPWTNTYYGQIGANQPGSIMIDGGTTLNLLICAVGEESTTSDGTLIVTGNGSTLNSAWSFQVGGAGLANLQIFNGGAVNSSNEEIGTTAAGAVTSITIDGNGSQWNCNDDFTINGPGTTTLNILNGGACTVPGIFNLENEAGSNNTINFDGGTLTLGTLIADTNQLTGTGNIVFRSTACDIDMVFDAANGMISQTLLNNQPGQNITTILDMSDPVLTSANPFYVGYENSGSMILQDGNILTTAEGYIGYGASATGTATVTGMNTQWSTINNLSVGHQGNGTLNILDGASVQCNSMIYIAKESNSTGVMKVDGPNSNASSSSLYVGHEGDGTLDITSSGSVTSTYGLIGYAADGRGAVTVAGNGSSWSNGTKLWVGYSGEGTMTILDGGNVTNTSGMIGDQPDATGHVTVDGSSSTWNNNGDLYIGNEGDGTLDIFNGSHVMATGTTYIAKKDDSTGKINFGTNGGTLTTGMIWAGSTQLTGVGTISTHGFMGDGNIVFDAASGLKPEGTIAEFPNQNITLQVDLSSHTENFGIGYMGSGSVEIREVVVDTGNGYLGYHAGSTGVITVTGNGSQWMCDTIYAGHEGNGTLHITNGGRVHCWEGNIAYQKGSTGLLTLSGPNSTLQAGEFNVGYFGDGTFEITNGGNADTGTCYIGRNAIYNGSGTVTVKDSGSIWAINNYLYLGFNGNGTLNISDGGLVQVAAAIITGAYDSTTTSKIDFDSGGGTLISNGLEISEKDLTGNGTVYAKGLVSEFDAVFDAGTGATQTIVMNNRPGQNVTIHLDLSDPEHVQKFGVGQGVGGNGSIVIKDGVTIYSLAASIGLNEGSSGIAIVTGANSEWRQSSTQGGSCYGYIGGLGDGALHILDGGTVHATCSFSGSIYIANGENSTGMLEVDGIGSTFICEYPYLQVGYRGTGTLKVTNGGMVTTRIGDIAHKDGTSQAIVDGAGSVWDTERLGIGYEGGTGTLKITNGGTVHCEEYLTIGNGEVIIDGQGSSMIGNSQVQIGVNDENHGNLTIINGGKLHNQSCIIGDSDPYSVGVATVRGVGSIWINADTLQIGKSSYQTRDAALNLIDGGTVTAESATVQYSHNVVNIDINSHLDIADTFTNNGTVNITAGITASSSLSAPITASSWAGTGSYRAFGGTWDETNHHFTLSGFQSGVAGTNLNIDLTQKLQVRVLDASLEEYFGVSFIEDSTTEEGSCVIGFVASKTGASLQNELTAVLAENDTILNCWDIQSDLADEELAFLSMMVDADSEDLAVWHYDGSGWSEYTLPDCSALSHDCGYACFLVDNLTGSYAIVGAAVPEPSTIILLLLSALSTGVLVFRKKA
ncbi:MAG: PEP-CTERM sorting domain-containing protein [Planctomycetia bacterium]|jgi:T5SS/PEP-CTERM-associated repeat protein